MSERSRVMGMLNGMPIAAGAFAFALAVASAFVVAPPLSAQESGIAIGAIGPDAALEALDGKPVALKSAFAAGKPTVIEFWATWCGNCKELEPSIMALQAKYAARVSFVGVAVSVNQSAERVRRYTAEHLKGFTHFYDRRGTAVEAYDVPATSYVVILDGAGKVVYTGVGGKQELEPVLAKLIVDGKR